MRRTRRWSAGGVGDTLWILVLASPVAVALAAGLGLDLYSIIEALSGGR
jgi:hypothetical protein